MRECLMDCLIYVSRCGMRISSSILFAYTRVNKTLYRYLWSHANIFNNLTATNTIHDRKLYRFNRCEIPESNYVLPYDILLSSGPIDRISTLDCYLALKVSRFLGKMLLYAWFFLLLVLNLPFMGASARCIRMYVFVRVCLSLKCHVSGEMGYVWEALFIFPHFSAIKFE